jgi:hypothetical protein
VLVKIAHILAPKPRIVGKIKNVNMKLSENYKTSKTCEREV